MGKSAIILGATGLTGGILLRKLLEDNRYDSVLVFGRNSCGIEHIKLREIILDLLNLEDQKDKFFADTVFCCVGTTKSKTRNKDKYKEIDKGIPISAACLSADNGIGKFMVISAMGANEKSRIFYNRVKGEMENELLKIEIPSIYIIQPSLIKGQREENRFGEKLAGILMNLFKPLMFGDLKKYKPISAEEIANCMIWLDNNDYESKRIPSDKIISISDRL